MKLLIKKMRSRKKEMVSGITLPILPSKILFLHTVLIILLIINIMLLERKNLSFTDALTNNGITTRSFTRSKKEKPKLVLIGGCTGTGKLPYFSYWINDK